MKIENREETRKCREASIALHNDERLIVLCIMHIYLSSQFIVIMTWRGKFPEMKNKFCFQQKSLQFVS
jgi:hypothetical protein